MAQFARPDSDISAGTWTSQGQASLYGCVDEETQNGDTDYILATSDTICELGLTDVTDPVIGTGHILRAWLKSSGGGAPERLILHLYEGATLRASSGNLTSRDAYGEGIYTLTEAEANAITNYANLSVKVESSNLAGGETMRVTQVEFEVPDAAGGVDVWLAGTSDGTATVNGAIVLSLALAGVSVGFAVVSGDLFVSVPLVGLSAGAASVMGNLIRTLVLDGLSEGSTSMIGDLYVSVPLAGISQGMASAAGNLVRTLGLEGLSEGMASAVGDLTVLGTVWFQGLSEGIASVTGTLKGTWALKGLSEGAASAIGGLFVSVPLAGISQGIAAASGVLKGTWALKGVSAGVATVSGVLGRMRGLIGSSAGAASALGKLVGTWLVKGGSAGIAFALGSLTLDGLPGGGFIKHALHLGKRMIHRHQK